MKRLISILVLTMTLPLGCDDDNSPTHPPQTPPPIVPLSVGARWAGTLRYDDGYGGFINHSWSQFITRDTLIDNETWYLVAHTRDTDTFPDNELWTVRTDGLWHMFRSLPQPTLIAKYPATAGDEFGQGEHLSYYHVASVDTTITTPLGPMRCYHYFYHPGNNADASSADIFFAPGVGRVYSYYHDDGFFVGTMSYILETYEP